MDMGMGWDGRWHQGSGNCRRQCDAARAPSEVDQFQSIINGIVDKAPRLTRLSRMRKNVGVRRCLFYACSTLVLRLCEVIPKHAPLSLPLREAFRSRGPRVLTAMDLPAQAVHANRAQVHIHHLLVARYMASSGAC